MQLQHLHWCLCMLMVATPLMSDTDKKCNKLFYVTAHHKICNAINIQTDCGECPGGIVFVESAELRDHNKDNEVNVYWNTSAVLLEVPQDSVPVASPPQEYVILVDVLYKCTHTEVQEVEPLALTVTIKPVELKLNLKEGEKQVTEGSALHFICELLGPIPNEKTTVRIEYTHNNKSQHIHECNDSICPFEIAHADLVEGRGYYFCTGFINDHGSELHHHCDSNPVFANIKRDSEKERNFLLMSVGMPVIICVLVLIVTLAVGAGIGVRWKRRMENRYNLCRQQILEQMPLLDDDQHRATGQRNGGYQSMSDGSSPRDTPSPIYCTTPNSSLSGTSPVPSSTSEEEGSKSVKSKDSKESKPNEDQVTLKTESDTDSAKV